LCFTREERIDTRFEAAAFASLQPSFAPHPIPSHLPTLMTLTPFLTSPSRMLSTAMLESDPAKHLAPDLVSLKRWIQFIIILTETAVFPVPGGPWMSVRREQRDILSASLCEERAVVRSETTSRRVVRNCGVALYGRHSAPPVIPSSFLSLT